MDPGWWSTVTPHVILGTGTSESAIADPAVTVGLDGKSYINAANFNGGVTTLSGTASAGDSVSVSVNGQAAQAATVNPDGSWTLQLSGLVNGASYSAVATATDAASESATSPAFAFTVDTSPRGCAWHRRGNLCGAAVDDLGDRAGEREDNRLRRRQRLGHNADGWNGAWSFPTGEDNSAIRVFSITAADAAGNASVKSGPVYLGTPGTDIFAFAAESSLAAAALISGGVGADTLQMTAAAVLTDADFAHVVSVETLGSTGVSSVSLGAKPLAPA